MDTDPIYFRPVSPRALGSNAKVSDLLLSSGAWDSEKILQSFVAFDAERILRIPRGPDMLEDKLVWHYSKDGIYSVKSGYWLASFDIQGSSSSVAEALKVFWKNN